MLLKQFALFLLIAPLLTTGCGGYSSSSKAKLGPPSTLTKRAFITNQFTGTMPILDVAKDLPSASAVQVGSSPSFMVVVPAISSTLVFLQASNTVVVVNNKTEVAAGNFFTLPGSTEQIVVSSDGKTAYTPIRSLAEVVVLDLTNRVISGTITGITGVRKLEMNKAGTKVLAFSDNQDSFFVINTADNTKTQISGFDRPFDAVFSADGSKAYVLNCGAECGGVAASVTTFDMGTLTAGASLPVGGATVGLTDGTNLYVAGTPSPGNGTLDAIALNSFSRTTATSVAISDGLHWLMALANGKLYIGARGCTITTTGCLSIYNTAGGSVVLSQPGTVPGFIGDVTSIEPINGRTVTYVIEGGNLRIYDQKTDAPQATQIEISGKVFDVKQVD